MSYLVKVNQVNRTYTIKRVERKIVIKRSGRRGLPGEGVPAGGTTGQVLAKDTDADYATEWVDVAASGVESVNGETGVVVLDTDDIADTATNRYTNDTDITRLANTSGTNTGDQDLSPYQLLSEKGQALGYAPLDNGGKVPVANLPASVMTYLGTWNAATNTPTLVNGTGDPGDLYIVSVAGTHNFGAGNITFEVGDWVMYNGTIWQRSDMSDAVSSVFGRQGAVTAQAGDYTASQVTNVAAGNIAAVTVQAAIDELDTEKVAKSGDTMAGTLNSQTILPSVDNTYSLGSGSFRYATITSTGLISDQLRTNNASSFLRLSGGPANDGGVILLGGSTNATIANLGVLRIGSTEVARWNSTGLAISNVLASTATHSLTLGSTATGIALYNTSDQTTNYERFRTYWSSNVLNIATENGGTGGLRDIRIWMYSSGGLYLRGAFTSTGHIQSLINMSTAGGIVHSIGGAFSATSGIQYGLLVNPSITQTGTAGYTALLVNPTHTTTGSGLTLLADFQLGGTSLVKITSAGSVIANTGSFRSNNGISNDGSAVNSYVKTLSTGTSIERDVADANTALIIKQINASSTGAILDAQFAGTSKFKVGSAGVIKRVTAIVSNATPTINTDNADAVDITALAVNITSMTTNLTGTPTNKQTLVFEIKDDGTPRAITWGASFVAGGVALPTTTVASKILTVGFMYSTANGLNKWRCTASVQEA